MKSVGRILTAIAGIIVLSSFAYGFESGHAPNIEAARERAIHELRDRTKSGGDDILVFVSCQSQARGGEYPYYYHITSISNARSVAGRMLNDIKQNSTCIGEPTTYLYKKDGSRVELK
jgi:hypothetical protein